MIFAQFFSTFLIFNLVLIVLLLIFLSCCMSQMPKSLLFKISADGQKTKLMPGDSYWAAKYQSKTCRHWKAGNCKRSDHCMFRHSYRPKNKALSRRKWSRQWKKSVGKMHKMDGIGHVSRGNHENSNRENHENHSNHETRANRGTRANYTSQAANQFIQVFKLANQTPVDQGQAGQEGQAIYFWSNKPNTDHKDHRTTNDDEPSDGTNCQIPNCQDCQACQACQVCQTSCAECSRVSNSGGVDHLFNLGVDDLVAKFQKQFGRNPTDNEFMEFMYARC